MSPATAYCVSLAVSGGSLSQVHVTTSLSTAARITCGSYSKIVGTVPVWMNLDGFPFCSANICNVLVDGSGMRPLHVYPSRLPPAFGAVRTPAHKFLTDV